jgi:two-component system LytT family response regulator
LADKNTTSRILIVDDEQIARQRIRRFLEEDSQEYVILEASNGIEAIERISSFQPHVVFLDIQMPELSGFDVLRQVENRNFQLIFQTAYDEYALQAFEESACDYLLKPFPKERLQKALSKALSGVDQKISLSALEGKLAKRNEHLEKITYKQGGKTKVLEVSNVLYFLSQDHCTSAFSSVGEHLIDLSLSHLEERLDPEKFLRCHRNNIVAVDQIKSVGGVKESEITLKNGTNLPVSRNNRSIVLERLNR